MDSENISSLNATGRLEMSKLILRVTLIPNVIMIPAAVVAFLCSLLTITVICWSKTLRTKGFAVVAANSFADLLIGLGYTGVSVERVYQHLAGIGNLEGMWSCFWKMSPVVFGQLLSLAMSAALVIERLLAIYCPMKYMQWTCRRVTVPLIAVPVLITLAELSVYIQNAWQGRRSILASCTFVDLLFPHEAFAFVVIQSVASGIIVILNIPLAYGIWRQKKKFKKPSPHQSVQGFQDLARAKSERKEAKVVCAIVVTQIAALITGSIPYMADIFVDDENEIYDENANGYASLAIVFCAAIDFVLLFAISSQFQSATKKLLRRNNASPVVAIQGNPPGL